MDFATELAQFNPDPALKKWLIAQLSAQEQQHQHSQIQYDIAVTELKNAQLKIQALTLELATLKRLKYGHKSESLSRVQQELFEAAYAEDCAALNAEVEQLNLPSPRASSKPTGRNPLPENLPRIEHCHEPESCSCAQCGQGLVKIGEDIREQLDVEPARFFVHRHIRPQ